VGSWSDWIRAWMRRDRAEKGQGLVEYGLIIAVIAIAVSAALVSMGQAIDGVLYANIVSNLLPALTP